MSGMIVEFEGRKFWDKHYLDVWLYNLFALIEQDNDYPDWIAHWIKQYKPNILGNSPFWMYQSFLDVLKQQDQIIQERFDQLLKYTERLQKRFEDYNKFLAIEKENWLNQGKNLTVELAYSEPTNHWQLLNRSKKIIEGLETFGYLFIKMLRNDNWKRAYFHSYANSKIVTMIDYLNEIKPNGQVILGSINGKELSGNILHWVSEQNRYCEIEWQEYVSITHGIPDLVVFIGINIGDDGQYDEQFLAHNQNLMMPETWEIDTKRQAIRILKTMGEVAHERHNIQEDFYSQTLGKTINLKFLYDIHM